jgi:hypothetical protein
MVILPFTSLYYVHSWGLRQWSWTRLILFLSSLCTCSTIIEEMVNWLFMFFFASLCAYSILCALEAPMRGSIYCLFSQTTMRLELALNYEMLSSGHLACDDFLHCLLWSLALVFRSYLLMIIACDVNDRKIVQSQLVFTACEVIEMFLLILGLWSLSVIVTSDVKLCHVGSERMPYSQILHC